MLSAREYYEQQGLEPDDPDFVSYTDWLEEYGDWLYHLKRDNNLDED